jgi:hypothetical protein
MPLGALAWSVCTEVESHGTFVTMANTDAILPSGPRQVAHTIKAPFARASREDDYRTAWAFFQTPADEVQRP